MNRMKFFVLVFFSAMIRFKNAQSATDSSQFQGFKIEWVNFNLLQCAAPMTININTLQCAVEKRFELSLFHCLPDPDNIYIPSLSCLHWFEYSFDQNVCTINTGTTNPTTFIPQTYIPQTYIPQTLETHTQERANTSSSQTTVTTATPIMVTTATPIMVTTATSTMVTTAATTSANLVTQNSLPATMITNPMVTSVTTEKTAHLLTSFMTAQNIQTTTISYETSTSIQETSIGLLSNVSTTTTTRYIPSFTGSDLVLQCPDGSFGFDCNITGDACTMANPCQNAATCHPNKTIPSGYSCNCAVGFNGENCENDTRPCRERTCWNNGTCHTVNSTNSSSNGLSFQCECSKGFTGIYCELEIDYCVNITCQNNGFCQTVNMNWTCVCLTPSHYYGDLCQYQTATLKVYKSVSKSMASVGITVITLTLSFFVIFDILKYVFHVDSTGIMETKNPTNLIKPTGSNTEVAVRFQYVNNPNQ